MSVSWESTSCTSVLPPCVPWLHTVTETSRGDPGVALGGPLTDSMMKSG
jgi:hypothetical protein